MSRTLPAAQRRAALLDATHELVVEHGVGGTSIDRVAARAGVSKGAVYHHFTSKDELVAALEQRFTDGILGRARAAADAAPEDAPPGDVLAAWAAGVVHGYLDDLALHDALFHGRPVTSREALSDNVLVTDLRAFLLDRGLRDGAPDADLVAGFVVGGITTAVDRAVLAGRSEPRDPVVAVAVACARGAAGLTLTP
ncbi:TetR/AcrR family transcriptional regulator [Pseudonocardia sp. DR1-2]|uniref:TetR/AcrR family transcriptional regulator n=1 Tax=Pseudonocardia sp. DR1-2 TaxID=2951168 RepID=UPI002043D286|nr:TetR/AcrR family transcriptional regulator [Pseudonocardia sp. DR1-2]MCM3849633.1 TetR/AcrR family transcriptional regulator [Pseudonocardia sp. DR1-2]